MESRDAIGAMEESEAERRKESARRVGVAKRLHDARMEDLLATVSPTFRDILTKHWELTLAGFGVDIAVRGSWWERVHACRLREFECREILAKSERQFDAACRWLGMNQPIKDCSFYSSYNLKHYAEDYANSNGWGLNYICNGAMIAAVIHTGFPYRRRPGYLSVPVGISKKTVRHLMREAGWTTL